MATLLKCGGLFLHVPQTGADDVSDALERSGLVFAHVGAQCAAADDLEPLERLLQVPDTYGKGNRPLFKFCFVRHPQRWYEALYRTTQTGGASFDEFVETMLRDQPGYLSALYASYTKDAHFVGRFERLAEDLQIVLTLLKVEMPDDVGRALSGSSDGPDKVRPTGELLLSVTLQQRLEEVERDAYVRYGYMSSETQQGPAPLSPFSPSVQLRGPFVREKGHAWTIAVAELARFADSVEYPRRSMVSLLENGMPLRLAHAAHDDIRAIGHGRFSHWGNAILFSTSDNTDPNDSGRRYDLAWVFPATFGATDLMMQPVVDTAAAKAA